MRKRPRILLADDDFEMRSLIATALRRDGCFVIEADDGLSLSAALGAALNPERKRVSLDLVISDLRMPGLSGLDVLVQQREGTRQVPFILMTAFGGGDVLDAAFKSGATVVLDKPFDLDGLRTLVFSLLGVTRPGSG